MFCREKKGSWDLLQKKRRKKKERLMVWSNTPGIDARSNIGRQSNVGAHTVSGPIESFWVGQVVQIIKAFKELV